jgi:hypothetical protein
MMGRIIMNAETAINTPFLPRWAIPLLLAVFAGGLLTIMPDYNAYFFGDEHFYTDSALRMTKTGQYLTPTYADGALRFNKPVLSYWMILGGFRLAGISVLSSRLASLAAGLLILLLTRKLTLRLFKSEAAAWLAMLILASNIALITASMRATPDVFLCLFSLASLYGFAGLLLGEPRRSDAWLAYTGAGLAVASKGLLGLLLLGFVLIFALCRPDRRARLRALLQPLPILACLVLALSWFVAVTIKHGDLALQGFFHDQVGNRVSNTAGSVLANLYRYTLGLALPFFPWSLLLAGALVAARPRLADVRRGQAASFLFVVAWYAVLLIVFSPANLTRTRYLLPAYPLLAAAAAALLQPALDQPAVARLLHRTLRAGLALLPLLAAALLLVALSLDRTRLAAAAAATVLLAAGIGFGLGRLAPAARPVLLALGAFGLLWTAFLLVRPAFPSSPAYALTRTLRRNGFTRVYFPLQAGLPLDQSNCYKEKYASQVRLVSGGDVSVERISLFAYLSKASRRPVICAGPDAALFPPERYKAVRSGSLPPPDLGPAAVWALLRAPDRKAALQALAIPCYVMFPKPLDLPERTSPP